MVRCGVMIACAVEIECLFGGMWWRDSVCSVVVCGGGSTVCLGGSLM